jgi:hypothetical protein
MWILKNLLLIYELLNQVVNQILKHMVPQNAVNPYVGPIKQEKPLIISKKEAKDKKSIISNKIKYLLAYQLFVKKL